MGDLPTFPLGSRVRHRTSGRIALVVGKSECFDGRIRLTPVLLEASTRNELWPNKLVDCLPLDEQPVNLGGGFTPPDGYPFLV